MSTLLSFFPDEASYRKWIQSMPGILRVMATGNGAFQEELDEDTDGPYFVAPGSEWLILRVGLPYCVVRRVRSAGEADFTWYVARTREEGEKVYAAYLRDERANPAQTVKGPTLTAARGALDEYLSSASFPGTVKRLLTRKLTEEMPAEQ
ncbi:MAG: hypothetical protein ACREDR_00320 [Blastocatellia bacterium]